MIGKLRVGWVLMLLVILTLALMPFQFVLNNMPGETKRNLPHIWHRVMARIAGLRVQVTGEICRTRPLLIVANHISWLDVVVLGSVAPLCFIAKKEVAQWPGAGLLAKLQRTIFVDRERRSRTGKTTDEITRRLHEGDVVVLFAEGTSTDGAFVLPFRSALLGAVLPKTSAPKDPIFVQPVALAYTGLQGMPTTFADRAHTGFYGDMDLAPHLMAILKKGGIDAKVAFGEPIEISLEEDRKPLTQKLHQTVRILKTGLLRGDKPA